MENYTSCGKLVRNTKSPSETIELGRKLAAGLKNENIFLWGELGAGKTTFLKGLGIGLGIKKQITSPSFQIVRKYSNKSGILRLIHLDLYRLGSPGEVIHLGWDEVLHSSAVTAIEWADRAWEVCPEKGLFLKITDVSPTERKIMIYNSKSSVPGI